MSNVYDIKLKPIHYASVSGGKDSLYMLGLILANPQKYPLDMVVNFELEIEWQVAKNVVDFMQSECNKHGIKFLRIKPRKSWQELYDRYGFPCSKVRWCNILYKLDCKKQLNEWIESQNCRPLAYIGLCADETKRFKYDLGDWEKQDICYPLAEEGIKESQILEWARNQDLFDGYYDLLDRMGCKACPLASMREWAYLLYKDQEFYEIAINQIRSTEIKVANAGRKYNFRGLSADEFDRRIRNKWLPILEHDLLYGRPTQLSLF